MKKISFILLFQFCIVLTGISQNVGINIPVPEGKLHIKVNSGTSLPHLRLTEDGNDFARIKMENTIHTDSFWDIAGKADADPNQSRLNFFFSNPTTTGDRMTILGNGNVGIGTSSPNSILHVDGITTVEDRIEFLNTGNSIFIGDGAGTNDDGMDKGNIAIGTEALKNNITKKGNIAIGYFSLHNNGIGVDGNEDASCNTALGYKSLFSNNIGYFNTSVGYESLFSNSFGASNTAVGYNALYSSTNNSDNNTAVGAFTLQNQVSGTFNTAVGYLALQTLIDGRSNTAVGTRAMQFADTASANVVIGNSAMNLNRNGNENTIIGASAGSDGQSYSGNIFLGYRAGLNESNSNRLYIDNSDISTPLIYGEFDNNLIKINGNQEIANGSLNIQSIGDGNELLRFTTDRPWVIKQSSFGVDTRLTLQSTIDGKKFEIVSVDSTKRAAVFHLSNSTSQVFLTPDNGNVGIGTDSPDLNNKLHVVSDGATQAALYGSSTGEHSKGIRVRTSGTGSSANAILAEYLGGGAGYAGWFAGNVTVAGNLSKTSGAFKIDHPLDPENKYLYHSFVESPDMMNIYNGNVITDANGRATVILPSYFDSLNIDFRYQLTVIGTFAQAIIGEKISDNKFTILTDKPNVEVSWQVTGIRNDAYAKKNRIRVEVNKEEENRGKFLNPEAFGLPREKAIGIVDKNRS